MEDPLAAAARLEGCFAAVERRMDGLPILNGALGIKAVGARAWQDHVLCVLITPWFMNLMLLPQTVEGATPVGVKRTFAFPAGRFEFIRGREGGFGPYWMCSLFSPMFAFRDQETAEAAAAAALDELFRAEEETSEAEREMAMIWRGETPEMDAGAVGGSGSPEPEPEAPAVQPELSRRALFTGRTAAAEA